jgi:transcription initiation factor TFIIH subunit 1
MEWIVDNEDILLQVRASYSKRPGTLFVTSRRVAWYQSTARAPQLSLPLSVLKGAPRRNKTGDAHILKVVLTAPVKDQADFNFVFETAADRDGVQEVVARLVVMAVPVAATAVAAPPAPAEASAAPKRYESAASRHVREAGAAGGEARRRAAALAGDAELRAVHTELVRGGVVGEEEFWALRAAELEQQRAGVAAQQESGMPSALVGDVRPVLVRPGEVHYRLTAPVIRQIFAERPAVRRAYQDNVPHRRSEEEFWREYLQSRYVEAAGPRSTSGVAASVTAGDIFAQAEAELEAERARQQPAVQALLATAVDVRTGEGEPEAPDLDCEEPATVSAVQTQVGMRKTRFC